MKNTRLNIFQMVSSKTDTDPVEENRKANRTSSEIREHANSHLFLLSPRQYWAGPHFFFNYQKKK